MDDVPVKGVQYGRDPADDQEEFRPASEVFGSNELDYLDKLEAQGGSAADIALGRQSLYVKFDPLVDSASQPAHVAAIPKAFAGGNDLLVLDTPEKHTTQSSAAGSRHGQIATPNLVSSDTAAGTTDDRPASTPTTHATSGDSNAAAVQAGRLLMDTPQSSGAWAGGSGSTQEIRETSSDVDMSVFTRPTPEPSPTPGSSAESQGGERPLSASPHSKSQDQTHTASSPVSRPSSTAPSEPLSSTTRAPQTAGSATNDLIDVLKYSEADVQRHVENAVAEALERLRGEGSKSAQDKMEKIDALTAENRNLQEKITADDQQLRDLRKVLDEYNASMTEKTEKSQLRKDTLEKEVQDLSSNNAELSADINSLENSFADLHNRYERLRAAVDTMRKNEATLTDTEKSLRQSLEKAGETNQHLKEHAAEQINQANIKMQKIVNDHRSEVAVLTANMKTLQVKADSLDRSLKQKEEENKELSTICEDMMKQMRQ
ncbi:transforming acidic coiled-coil-containing protein 3-like [Sycon ciliatum]|uniref:transforming acidic coiled-coil-containing protein 3-like n=1 Tax=Sycon ciliatum TaxID=27933 RepID=UPI0020AE6EB8|eukprot:scpid69743/ scgid17338/ Transforming acidic coiled-coil-containing protein 3; Cytoplasmic polyadenylation element-binding protein-associated factor Maskin